MQSLNQLLDIYGESHKNGTNKAIHWICLRIKASENKYNRLEKVKKLILYLFEFLFFKNIVKSLTLH